MTGGDVLQAEGPTKRGIRPAVIPVVLVLLVGVTAVVVLRLASGDQDLSPQATAEVEIALTGFLDVLNRVRVDPPGGGDLPPFGGRVEVGSDQVRAAVESRLTSEQAGRDSRSETAYVDYDTAFDVHTATEHDSGEVSVEGTERRVFTIESGGDSFPSISLIPHRFVLRIDDGVVVLLDWDEARDAGR